MLTAQQLISQYQLQAHPEGGFYTETYRSKEEVTQNSLPARFPGSRVFSTAICFLLQQEDFSAFHRIKSDECWHFYAGGALNIYIIDLNGGITIVRLGNNPANGELFQYVVPAGFWFASQPAPGSIFSFVGCTVAPGFDFADFEMADEASLCKEFPSHESIIKKLCRQPGQTPGRT